MATIDAKDIGMNSMIGPAITNTTLQMVMTGVPKTGQNTLQFLKDARQ